MTTCDSQIHVFPAGSEERAIKFGQHPMSVEEILSVMDGAGIDRAILVPANPDHTTANQEAAIAHPDRFRSMGLLKLNRPMDEAALRAWFEEGWLGVRVSFPPWHAESWLRDGTADWFWPLAASLAIPVMAWAPRQLADLADVARAHPDVRLAVDHLGLAIDDRDDAIDAVLDDLVRLADLPNVSVKATSLPGHVSDGYPFVSLQPRIARVVGAFGPERVFWGSDLTRLECRYPEAVDLMTKELDFLTQRDQEEIMGEAVLRWAGWSA